jgi:hypothetical protein
MPLNNARYILDEIENSQDDVPQFDQLNCWEKPIDEYKIFIFSIQIAKESDLIGTSNKLRDFIAIYFQSQVLEKMVEKWNVYQVIIVSEEVSTQVKQKVEQDKFATRKIVFSGFSKDLTDVEVSNLISNDIFNFTITPVKKDFISFKDSISVEDEEVIDIVSEYSSVGIKGSIDVIVDRLSNE